MSTLARLRTMPAREIGYRLREKLSIEAERVRLHLHSGTSHAQRKGSCYLGSLALAFESRFYVAPSDRSMIRRFVEAHFPSWIEKAIVEADHLCSHRMELLGYDAVKLGHEINWHRDPITGVEWPRRFWADYDPVSDTSFGDTKTIHELNRHQHLPRLGKAFFLTGEQRYASEAVSQMLEWVEQNPVGLGINWQSSLEISIRILSWLWTICFVFDSQAFTEDAARRITESLLEQVRHVYHYPSVYSSPNTHLIGEATALFITGLLLSGTTLTEAHHAGLDQDEAGKWRNLGAELLKEEIRRQVLADGVHCELSTYYHCYATDLFLQALILTRRGRVGFSTSHWDAVEHMLEFVMHVSAPDGAVPKLGDDDGGRALALDQRDYRSYLDGLCVGSLIYNRPDFKHQSQRFCEEAFWLLGRESWMIYQQLDATAPQECARMFSSAGYVVQRSEWTPTANRAIFDCGGLGLPTGGHGHADALSMVLSCAGRDVLIDPGTFVYNGAPQWREFFRSTRAHNTVVVDGQSQSEPAGTFQWKSRAIAEVRRHFSLAGLDYVEAEHTGYTRLAQPVIHKRRVLYSRPGTWIVIDEITGKGTHAFDFCYHFPSTPEIDLTAGPDDSVRIFGDGFRFFLDASHPLTARLAYGEDNPKQGWSSAKYGAKAPIHTLCASIECPVPLKTATVIAACDAASNNVPEVWRETFAGSVLSNRISHGSTQELLILPEDNGVVEAEGFQLKGELFLLRTSNGVPQQLLGIGVQQIRRDDGDPRHAISFDTPFAADHVLMRFTEEGVVMNNGVSEDERLCAESAAF